MGRWAGGLGTVRFLLEIFFRGGWIQGFSFWGGVWTSSGGLSNAGFEILRLSFPFISLQLYWVVGECFSKDIN